MCALFTLTVLVSARSLPSAARTVPAGFWALAALAVAAEAPTIVTRRASASPAIMASVTFCYALSFEWGGFGIGRLAQAAAILLVAAFAWSGLWTLLFNLGRYGLALAAAGSVVALLGRPGNASPDVRDLVDVLLAAAAWYFTFRLLSATGTWLQEGGRWTRALRRDLPAESLTAAALLLLSPMLLLLARSNAWLIPLVFAPVFAVSQMARLHAQRELRATQDPLTGLPNRLAMSREAEAPIERCTDQPAETGTAALLVLDIVSQGQVNVALGHRVGDQVIAAVARRLAAQAGPHSLVARLQSDEFAVFLWDLAGADEALERAAAVRALLDEPITVAGQPLTMSVCVGIALCPAHGANFDDLARHADSAMKRAKSLPDPVTVFCPDQDEPVAGQLSLLSDLRQALEEPGNTQIVPYYQPQVDMATGEVAGVEALLRWRHPDLGMVSPEEVVRLAEHTPLMRKISMTILEQVLAQLAAWRAQGLQLTASVNVSVRDLHSDELVTWLAGRLRHYDVEPSRLQLELTESALIHHGAAVLHAVQSLRRLGVGASLDDFGTGFSSLQHLRRLPLTEIKIDRSFVESMLGNRQDEAIVQAVINLGRDLGLRVVAEGVEDEQTELMLLAHGCRLAQGWYYSAALPADECLAWCGRHRAGTARRPSATRAGSLAVPWRTGPARAFSWHPGTNRYGLGRPEATWCGHRHVSY